MSRLLLSLLGAVAGSLATLCWTAFTSGRPSPSSSPPSSDLTGLRSDETLEALRPPGGRAAPFQPGGATTPPPQPTPPEDPTPPSYASALKARWNQALLDFQAQDVPVADRLQGLGSILSEIGDDDFVDCVAPLVRALHRNDAEAEALWLDLAGRPNSLTLPLLADLCTKPAHPFNESARAVLQGLLRDRFSEDPQQLRQAIADYTAASG